MQNPFFILLGLTNSAQGGIIGVDCEVNAMPDNSYTQTTTYNGSSFGVLYAIIFIIVFSLIGFLIYSVTRKASPKTIKEPTKVRKKQLLPKTQKKKNYAKKYTHLITLIFPKLMALLKPF